MRRFQLLALFIAALYLQVAIADVQEDLAKGFHAADSSGDGFVKGAKEIHDLRLKLNGPVFDNEGVRESGQLRFIPAGAKRPTTLRDALKDLIAHAPLDPNDDKSTTLEEFISIAKELVTQRDEMLMAARQAQIDAIQNANAARNVFVPEPVFNAGGGRARKDDDDDDDWRRRREERERREKRLRELREEEREKRDDANERQRLRERIRELEEMNAEDDRREVDRATKDFAPDPPKATAINRIPMNVNNNPRPANFGGGNVKNENSRDTGGPSRTGNGGGGGGSSVMKSSGGNASATNRGASGGVKESAPKPAAKPEPKKAVGGISLKR